MATLYGKNFTTINGSPGSAGTNDIRVDRPNEGLSGQATTQNVAADGYSPATPTRGNFDTFKAIGKVSKQVHIIDTTGTNYVDPWTELKNALPGVF